MKKPTSKTKHDLLGVADSPLLPIHTLAEKIKLSECEAQQLKRDLLTRAIQRETEYLFSTNFVRAIRPNVPQESVSAEGFHKKKPLEGVDVSFLRFFYDHYVARFPFLINTDLPKFLEKLEKFQDEVIKANLSSDAERSETTKRKLIILRLQKLLVLLYNNAIPIVTEGLLAGDSSPQEVSHKGSESNPTSPTSPVEELETMCGVPHLIDIVGVRVVTVKGAFRLSSHAKFIIRISKREK
ncbi:hypothetical protein DSO57_1000801 [Entomophthora muscae]|uniref:Uncharacterized protein n=1 Tax=Entomophthora muscae TaxID=34485 RepID=A0ACC2U830_9FUNG|nr:hypothetical protein DSO57_1000801 [Entomophthora muscae]